MDVNGFSQDLVLLVPFLHVPAMWIYPCRLPAPGKEVLAQAKPGTECESEWQTQYRKMNSMRQSNNETI